MEEIIGSGETAARRHDRVAAIADRWREIDADLDPSPLLVMGRLARVAALVDQRLRPPFASAGLSDGDFDLLAALRRQPPPHELRPGELATEMMVTTGATTKRIDRLEAQRYVTRRVAATDGRSRVVKLTTAGRTMVDELMKVHLDNEAAILRRLTAAQRGALAELLGDLLGALETPSDASPAAAADVTPFVGDRLLSDSPPSPTRSERTAMTGSSAPDIAVSCLRAWTTGDFDTVRALVRDDVTFVGAMGTTNGVEDYVGGLQRLSEIVSAAEITKVFTDADEVCILYDLVTEPAGPLPCVAWYQIRDAKIASKRVYFDPRPLL